MGIPPWLKYHDIGWLLHTLTCLFLYFRRHAHFNEYLFVDHSVSNATTPGCLCCAKQKNPVHVKAWTGLITEDMVMTDKPVTS